MANMLFLKEKSTISRKMINNFLIPLNIQSMFSLQSSQILHLRVYEYAWQVAWIMIKKNPLHCDLLACLLILFHSRFFLHFSFPLEIYLRKRLICPEELITICNLLTAFPWCHLTYFSMLWWFPPCKLVIGCRGLIMFKSFWHNDFIGGIVTFP